MNVTLDIATNVATGCIYKTQKLIDYRAGSADQFNSILRRELLWVYRSISLKKVTALHTK